MPSLAAPDAGVVAILALSLALQLAAAVLALCLLRPGRGTGESRRAWLFIACALLLMALRRLSTLIGLFVPAVERLFKGPVAELIALAIAALMLVGVVEIARAFRAQRRTAEALAASIDEHRRTEEVLRHAEAQLRQTQRLEAVGRLAGGIAHDFNNLLTAINGYGELALAKLREDQHLRPDLEEIRRAGERAVALTGQLLAFGRNQVLEPKVLDLNAVVGETDRLLRRLIGEDIEVVTALAADLGAVRADPGQVEQVLMNLVVNARDAMPRGGKLTIETGNADLDEHYAETHPGVEPGRYVLLAVSDNGCGMEPETLGKIFEPFFTTKEKGKGTGLGLSTVYGIVRQSGGTIWVYSEPGKGATFKVYLPRVAADVAVTGDRADADPPTPLPAIALGGEGTVLLVEDEPMLRPLIGEVLRGAGYRVIEAGDGLEAARIGEERREPIHLLVTDLVMPGMGGLELRERLAATHPETRVLFISGYTELAALHHGVVPAGAGYLAKPFTPSTLVDKVSHVLQPHPSACASAAG